MYDRKCYQLFELAIPDAEKTANGAVYTPKYSRDYIVRQVMHSVEKPLAECLCADISCGCGAFLYTLAEYIHEHTGEQYSNILPTFMELTLAQLT